MNFAFIKTHRAHPFRYRCLGFATLLVLNLASISSAQDVAAKPTAAVATQNVWPDLAPGETTANSGKAQPPNEKDPSVIRIANITQPTLDIYPAEEPNGTAMLVLPGGGFSYVVPNKEGSEAAPFFNDMGVSLFVLKYRTGNNQKADVWQKPVQDAQRSLRWIRANAHRWGVDPDKLGVLGFSAGGQASSFLLTADEPLYEAIDQIDQQSFRPSFGVLVYAWRLLNKQGVLKDGINVSADTPETILIHTHDDRTADARGAVKFYLALKEAKVSSELHVFRTGGHGYGIRQKRNSVVHKWPGVVKDWLEMTVFKRGKR